MDQVIVWSGWVGGIAIGLYLLAQYWLTGRALGASTGYGNVCAFGSNRAFFRSGTYSERWSWRLFFMAGIPLGGFLGVVLSPNATFAPSFSLGPLYDSVMPDAIWARGVILLAGGALIGYGARMAGGCTSGHSITGLALLNPPSLIASVGFFVGGIVAVQLLFGLAG